LGKSAYEEDSPFEVIDTPLPAFYAGWNRVPWVIVVHFSAGYNAEDCYNTLRDRGLSTHCTIERDGQIWKHVGDEHRGIHAGYGRWGGRANMNHHALGFEIANIGAMEGVHSGRGGYLGREVNTLGDGTKYFRHEKYTKRDGTPGVALVTTKTKCQGYPDHREEWAGHLWSVYPQEQLEAVFWVIWKWCEAYDILPENVVGHEHVTPHRKTDPGPAFPWQELEVFLHNMCLAHKPELVDPSHRRKDRIRSVQSHLDRLGLDVGDIDGVWGLRTQNALSRAITLYGDIYGFSGLSAEGDNPYEVSLALRRIPGFDPGRR
jgi:N-acetyl-anhydromuramyl-L-alanine amidase AmpD